MSWYLAPSLTVLRAQVNARWPERDKGSDGSVGDAAHMAKSGGSDHNPAAPTGVVRAVDLDKDGINPMLVVLAAIAHPSTSYVIWSGSIWSRAYGFRRRDYTGVNGHYAHVHISISHAEAAEESQAGWLGGTPTGPTSVVSAGRVPVTTAPVVIPRPATRTVAAPRPKEDELSAQFEKDARADLARKQQQLDWLVAAVNELNEELRAKNAPGRLGSDLRASHDVLRQGVTWLTNSFVNVALHMALPGDQNLPEAQRATGGRLIKEIHRIVTAARQ